MLFYFFLSFFCVAYLLYRIGKFAAANPGTSLKAASLVKGFLSK